MRHLVLGLVMALLLSSSAIGSGSSLNAFITNSGSENVSVVDTTTFGVSSLIVHATTRGVAMDPKLNRAYVAAAGGSAGSVYVIQTDATPVPVVLGSAMVGKSPFGVAVSSDGQRLYVAHGGSGKTTFGTVSAFNIGADGMLTLVRSLAVGGAATGLALDANGTKLYVANAIGKISVLNTAWFADPPQPLSIPTAFTGGGLVGIAVSPDGNHVYAADNSSSTLFVVNTNDLSFVSVALVDPHDVVGKNPYGVAASPDGRHVYVANFGSDNLSIVDTGKIGTADNPVSNVNVGRQPLGVAVTSDGSRVYVVNSSLSFPTQMPGLTVLNATGGFVKTIDLPLMSFPVGLGPFLPQSRMITVSINVVQRVINLKAQGTVPVMIFGSDPKGPNPFDVHDLSIDDFKAMRFNGWPVKFQGNGEPMVTFNDFNHDGWDDVTVHIDMGSDQNSAASLTDPVAKLTGQISNGPQSGMQFQGTDNSVKFLH